MAWPTRRSIRFSNADFTHHVFGVDFGITKATVSRILMEELQGTGASTGYAASDVLARIERNSEWSNSQGCSVPMKAYYDPRGNLYVGKSCGAVRGGLAWVESHEIPSKAAIVRFMKLSLHVSEDTKYRRTFLQEQASQLNKRPDDFVQDILVFLREQCEEMNRKHLGTGSIYSQNSYVLSVPAAWTNLEQQVFLEAAKKAGMYDVSLVSEAEAVAAFLMAKHSYLMKVKNMIFSRKRYTI